MTYEETTRHRLLAELTEMRRATPGAEPGGKVEARYRALADQLTDGIIVIQDGACQFVNKAVAEILGYQEDQIVGMSISDMATPESKDSLARVLELAATGEELSLNCITRLRCRDGTNKAVSLSVAGIRYNGRPASLAILGDAKTDTLSGETFPGSQELFRSLFEQSPIGIMLHDATGRPTAFNRAALDVFGLDDLDLATATNLFDEPDLPSWAKAELREGKIVRYEGPFDFQKARSPRRVEYKRRGVIHIYVILSPLRVNDIEPIRGYLLQIQDTTERTRAQDALRELSHRLVEVQELERRNIARELHDQVGQALTGLKLAVETAVRLPPESAALSLSRAQTLINELMTQIKNLSLDLRPSMLDDLGLLPTLLWHFERYTAQTGVHVAFGHSGSERRFPPAVETATYRIVQEALTNVARHAAVSEVDVRLFASDDTLTMEIEDHGSGFQPKAAMRIRTSSGLIGMRERAMALGGRLAIDSHPGAGTRLTLELPLSVDDTGRE